MTQRRVLIAYASIGSGHKAAAAAIRDAIQAEFPEWELAMVDTVETSEVTLGDGKTYVIKPSRVARESKRKFLEMREKMPVVTSAVVDAGDYDWSVRRTLGSTLRGTVPAVTRRLQRVTGVVKPGVVYLEDFMKLLQDANFDIVISTHFYSAHALATLKDKGKQMDTLSFVVVTDYHAHKTWKARHVDRYFAPAPRVGEEIGEWYADTNREKKPPVQVSGIPVAPKIGEVAMLDKAELRKTLGLPHASPGTKIFLATLTSESLDDSKLAWSHIVKWASENPHHYVILIAGRLARERLEKDEHGRRKLEKSKSQALDDAGRIMIQNVPNAMVVGFTSQMAEYMRASDVIISKPGGLTVAESLVFGLAWMIVKPWLLDVERPNADFLQNVQVAKLVDEVTALEAALESAVGDENSPSGWFFKAQAYARDFARPDAAMAVVRATQEALSK